MKYSKGMLYGVLGLILAHPAYANLDCVEQPTCSELGYSNTESCTTGGFIVCPFDPTYKKCVPERPDCEALGFTDTPKDEWCEGENLIKCPTDTSYTLCAWHSFEEGCEASGYYSINEDLICTEDEFVDLTLTDGTTVTCATECYASCMDAGYDLSIEDQASVYCEGEIKTFYKYEDASDYISSVDCGKTCHQVYSTCEQVPNADLVGGECVLWGQKQTIYTSEDGDTKDCYDGCVRSCEDLELISISQDVDAEYVCVSITVKATEGNRELRCYTDCVDIETYQAQQKCITDHENCIKSCGGNEGVGRSGDEISAYNECITHCGVTSNVCKNQLSFFRMDDMEKIKVASVSEDFAIEKYVKAFNFDEEDCPIYKL